MGRLDVAFKIGLANPIGFPVKFPNVPATIEFPESGNTVRIEPPTLLAPGLMGTLPPGVWDFLTLHVERDCEDEVGRSTAPENFARLSLDRDAAKAFWFLFETIRDVNYRDQFIAGYSVAPAENLGSSPLVKSLEIEWKYDGRSLQTMKSAGVATVRITEEVWLETVRRLSEGVNVPPYRSFALDALYFATSGDPLRAIVMACAAWETALREYLRTVAGAEATAYKVAAEEARTIPTLYRFVKAARGYEHSGESRELRKDLERQLIQELPRLRNKLLHLGQKELPEGTAVRYALAVVEAIRWLFD